MMDVEAQIAESFERLYPVPFVTADWDDVLDRARPEWTSRIALFAPIAVRRRVGLVAGLAVLLGGAVLAAGMLGKSPDVLERAQAALDPNGRILHIVDRWGDGPGAVRGEAWQLPDGSLDHVIYRSASGALGADCVISETQTRCWNPTLNVIDLYQHWPPEPGYPRGEYLRYGSDWPASLRRALGSGYARLLGETKFDGRSVFAVLLGVSGRDGSPQFQDGVSDTLYVDRETYLPVAEHMPAGDWTRYFDTFEFLPDTAGNRKAVELPAKADAPVIVHPVGEYPPEGK
jgi:hypothetical protein